MFVGRFAFVLIAFAMGLTDAVNVPAAAAPGVNVNAGVTSADLKQKLAGQEFSAGGKGVALRPETGIGINRMRICIGTSDFTGTLVLVNSEDAENKFTVKTAGKGFAAGRDGKSIATLCWKQEQLGP